MDLKSRRIKEPGSRDGEIRVDAAEARPYLSRISGITIHAGQNWSLPPSDPRQFYGYLIRQRETYDEGRPRVIGNHV